uniref:Extensin n=1 Tax=Solanum tuberosum TaxID=4113 RepID=M1DU57_SOLTU
MKEMSKRTLVDKMREEAERTMAETLGKEMKEEGTQVDIKNLQMAEMDIDFSSAEGTMGEETNEDGAEVDIDFSSVKVMVTEKVDEEIKEDGADMDTNNPAEEEPFGNYLPCDSNYA